jgi:imidazolonepropionase
MLAERLWTNARIATMVGDGLGVVEDAAIAMRDGLITYVGPMGDAPDAVEIIDCAGRWITPGLIDCHTHLVYAGDRSGEFEQRLAGASYEDVARAGGGILSTMRATRAADEAALVAAALPRLDAFLAEGVTTIEVKSGYGLTLKDELKMLRAARKLAEIRDVAVTTTFLGAHALPPEFANDADGYIALICNEIIPEVASSGAADAVDAFCDAIAFSPAQTQRVFAAARAHNLPVKIHAEQLSNQHATTLAAHFSALSADHLEYLDPAGILAMAHSGTVATLLPGAYYFTRETQLPPIDGLRAAGVPIAVASDCNPGTSPLTSLLLTMNMAATCFRLTVEECLRGVTVNAARALGRHDRIGILAPGMRCDLAIWNIERPAALVYHMGLNPLHTRIVGGRNSTPPTRTP